ncbi:MAG: hypothetical protein HYV07_10050 [Deltaproteobacteria bacterium]|nr:hypothetical protein [Deltaproteobacteria bacterium]
MKRKKSGAGPNGVEKPDGATSKRFTDDENARALKLVQARQSLSSAAKAVGTSSESVR